MEITEGAKILPCWKVLRESKEGSSFFELYGIGTDDDVRAILGSMI